MRTMVATNQRDYATVSHVDMAGSHDKSSCRSATINNNIWTAGWRDGWRDSSSLNSVIRSVRRAALSIARALFRPAAFLDARSFARDNKSIDERHRGRTGARIPRECGDARRFGSVRFPTRALLFTTADFCECFLFLFFADIRRAASVIMLLFVCCFSLSLFLRTSLWCF